MNIKNKALNKEEVHLLLLSELPEKLENYELKYFVSRNENDVLIESIPFVYKGHLSYIKEKLAYDADDFSEEDLSKFYPLIKSFVKNSQNNYELIYVPKKILKRKLFSQTKSTK